jgi:predicted XRE-type DNA-binding protein
MKYPSKEKLKLIDDKLKTTQGTLILSNSASSSDKFRWELCQKIVKHMVSNKLTQVELAEKLRTDPSRISEVVNHRVDKVSTDKLLDYVEKLMPNISFKIA